MSLGLGVFNKILDKHLDKCMPTPIFEYTVELKVDGKPFKVFSMNTFIREADYYNTLFERVKVLIAVAPTTKNQVLSKAFDKVTVTIIARINNKPISRRDYIAFPHDVIDRDMEALTKNMVESYKQDLMSLAWVQLELIEESGWEFKLKQIGGQYPGTNPLNLIKFLLSKYKLRDKLGQNEFIFSYNIAEEEQTDYSVISIKDGLNFLDLFDFLQNHYGVYDRGIGAFLNRQQWTVFKPYDKDKFDKGGKRLVIYNVPHDQMSHIENNFYVIKDVTYLALSGETKVLNQIDSVAYNEGTGVRFNDIRALEKRNSQEIKKDVYETNPALYMTQVNTNPLNNGVYAPVASETFTDNPKKFASEMAKRRGVILQLVWDYGMYQLLEPGMGISLYYPSQDRVKNVKGVLLGAIEINKAKANDFNSNVFIPQVALTIMVFPYG